MTENKENENEFNRIFQYYEKAIDGRNFHYQNYNTWANYYSIFTGALFVGFYTIIKDDYSPCKFLSFLIVILGLITSVCWNLTVKGHYHWMLSWIKVVHKYEKELANFSKKKGNPQYFVYSVYFKQNENSLQKNISSQKLTSKFTFVISLAWALLLFLMILNQLRKLKIVSLNSECCWCVFSILFALITTFVIYLFAYLFFEESSSTEKMRNSIKKIKKEAD